MADQIAASGVKKINEGLSLSRAELRALSKSFVKSEYFAHIKFGIETGRIDPEELIHSMESSLTQEEGILYFLSFLLKNNLDVNYYFETVYGQKLHILVYIVKLSGGSTYTPYIVDMFHKSGCNLGLNAILRKSKDGNIDKSKTVEQEITESNMTVIRGSTLDKISIKNKKFEWKNIIRPILLDKFTDKDKLNLSDLSELEKMYLMNIICVSESKNIIKYLNETCIFKNEILNMKQSIYFAINSQNYEIFRIMLQKGLLCNYTEMTELIFRHNLASAKKDNILKKTYSKMILFAMESGSEMDNNQLRLLSIEATVELIERIKEAYSKPEWRKLCSKTNLNDNDMSNEKIRKIAFNLNINFSLPPYKICEKLEMINNSDRLEYVRSAIIRQEERVARSLIEIGELRPEDKLENCRCDKQTMLLNNPYAYNDARMSFYKDETDGKLWCFTSDMFESLVQSQINPYNKKRLPEMFIETITSQLNILETLDLKPDKDMKSIGETLEDVFDSKKELNSRFSDDEYNSFINSYRLITTKQEEDFRSKSISNTDNIWEVILLIYFNYFTDCKDEARIYMGINPFSEAAFTLEDDNVTINPLGSTPNLEMSNHLHGIFSGAKFIKEMKANNSGELFFKAFSFILINLEKKLKNGNSKGKHFWKDEATFMKNVFTKINLI